MFQGKEFFDIRTWISTVDIKSSPYTTHRNKLMCSHLYIFFWNDDFRLLFQLNVFKTAYEFQLSLLFLPYVHRGRIFFSTRLVHNRLTEQLLCHSTYCLKLLPRDRVRDWNIKQISTVEDGPVMAEQQMRCIVFIYTVSTQDGNIELQHVSLCGPASTNDATQIHMTATQAIHANRYSHKGGGPSSQTPVAEMLATTTTLIDHSFRSNAPSSFIATRPTMQCRLQAYRPSDLNNNKWRWLRLYILNAYHAHWLYAYDEAYALENRTAPSFLEIHTTACASMPNSSSCLLLCFCTPIFIVFVNYTFYTK